MDSMYEVRLAIVASNVETNDSTACADHFACVVDEFAKIEASHDDLLDVAFGFTDVDEHGRIDVEVTVMAADRDAAYMLASSSVRAAIQAAGGFTPDWMDLPPSDRAIYRVEDGSVELIPA